MASAACLVGTAGCMGEGDSGGPTDGDATTSTDPAATSPTPTDATTGSSDATSRTPTVDPASLVVSRTRVLPWLVGFGTPDSYHLVGDVLKRYVLVTVDATDATTPPARGEFGLLVGDRSYEPRVEFGRPGLTYANPASDVPVYGVEGPSGDVPFEVDPGVDAPRVALQWPGGDRPLDGVGEALSRPRTSFEVESFAATSDRPGHARLSATVRNVGDHRGWLVGAVNRRGPSVAVRPITGVTVEVPPGTTGTWRYTDDRMAGTGTAEYTLRTEGGTRVASVVVGESGALG